MSRNIKYLYNVEISMYLILPRLRPGVRDLGPLSGLVAALQTKVELLLRAVTRKLRIPSIL